MIWSMYPFATKNITQFSSLVITVNGVLQTGLLSFGFWRGWKGGLERGWRGVGEGLGKSWGGVGEGMGKGWGGLGFLYFKNPVLKDPVNVP